MAREDDETAVDTLLRHTSPAAPAPSETAGLARAPQTASPEPEAGHDTALDKPPPAASSEPPTTSLPTMVPAPDPGVDLWAQRRARVERLRAEEAAQETLEAAQEMEAEAAQALKTATDTVAEPGEEPATSLETKLEIDAMPDCLEGLRRRRPDADAPPDHSGAETPRSAAERVKQEARSGTATPAEEQQCRICFGGREEEAELGRLISPCLCAGSMRVSAPRPR